MDTCRYTTHSGNLAQKTEATHKQTVTVEDNTVAGSTVSMPTVRDPNDAIEFGNTLHKHILYKLSAASQLKFTEIMESDMEALCSVILQQKPASCKEERLAVLKK